MNRKTSFIILILFFPLVLFNYESNSAFSQKTADQEALKYEVAVTLKLVQVYVMDSHGTPVTDLKKEDFELYDNGKLQSITDFEKHVLFALLDKTERPGKEEIPSQTKFNRKFFIFFDLAFNSARGINNSKKAALYFIDHQLHPSDEVGVLSYSATKYLTVHENLTTNHKKVREAVEGIGTKKVLGRAEDVEQKYWGKTEEMAQPENSGSEETQKALQIIDFNQIRFDRLEFKQHVLIFIRTMKELGQALSHIQGRKDILYLSCGIPGSIFEGDTSKKGAGMRDFIFQDAFADIRLNDRYDEMIRMLAASNSSIYPLYAEGISTSFQDRQQLGKSSLQRMAADTGGEYFGNIQNYEKIMAEIQKATSSFYVLGYYIGQAWDGKYHDITVRTKRKGFQVQAQAGYFNPKLFSELTALEKKMDFIELALDGRSQFLAPLHFPEETMHFATERISGFVMLSKIPAAAVQELSGKQVEIVNLIFDEKDDLRHLKGWRVDFTKLPQKDIFLYSLASLPPGRYKPRIVIRNTKTGKSIVSSVQAGIQEPTDSGLKLSSPLLLVPEKGAVYLKGERLKEGDKDQKTIDLTDIFPCNFNLWAPVVEEMEQGRAGLTAVVRSYVPECQYPDMIISPRLMDQSTGEIILLPFSVSRRDPENHSQISFITFPSERLKPGKYILHFDAEETRTRLKSSMSAAFSIK